MIDSVNLRQGFEFIRQRASQCAVSGVAAKSGRVAVSYSLLWVTTEEIIWHGGGVFNVFNPASK